MTEQACRRCGDPEFRIHGYCSLRCEDLHEVEQERDEARAEAAEYKGSFLAVDGVLAMFFDRPDDREAEDIAAYIRRERAELRDEIWTVKAALGPEPIGCEPWEKLAARIISEQRWRYGRTASGEVDSWAPARNPEALLIPNGGTGIVDFTCGRCGRRNRVTVQIDAGEKANLPVECDCGKTPWEGTAEVIPYDAQWIPPD